MEPIMSRFTPQPLQIRGRVSANPGQYRHLRTIWTASLAAALLLALNGCAAVKVKLGMRVYLEKTPVASITVSLPNGPGVAPGEKSPLVVTVTQPDGKVLQTEGKGGGKVLWQDLQVTASLVTANK